METVTDFIFLVLKSLMLKLKLQYFDCLMCRASSLEKTLIVGKIESSRRGSQRVDALVAWHRQLNGHEFEQTPGDSEGQGRLALCNPWKSQTPLSDWRLTKTLGMFTILKIPSDIWFCGTVGDIKTNSTRMRSTWLLRYQIKRVKNVSFLSYFPLWTSFS